MAAAKIWAVKAGTSIDPARLPCWPACLFWFSSFRPLQVDFLQTHIP